MRVYAMNNLSRMSGDEDMEEYMNDYLGHEYTDEEMEGLSRISEDELIQGLSRLETMSDEEMDETLGKFRIRFGKGKGKAKRKQKRHIKRVAKAAKKEAKKHERHRKRVIRKAKRTKSIKDIGKFVTGIATGIGGGGKGGEVQQRIIEDMIADNEPTEDDIKWFDKEWLGMPVKNWLWIGGGALAVTGTIIVVRRGRKKKGGRR